MGRICAGFVENDQTRHGMTRCQLSSRWARHRESARQDAVRPGSFYPWDIRQRDSDVDLPHRKTRRPVSPYKSDAPTVCVLSSVSSSLSPHVDIYDGRPPILPVSIQALNLRGHVYLSVEDSDSDSASDSDSDSDAGVAASAVPPHVFTPLGDPLSPPASRSSSRHNVHRDSPVPMLFSEPAVMSSFSNDTDPDLADVLSKLSPSNLRQSRWHLPHPARMGQ